MANTKLPRDFSMGESSNKQLANFAHLLLPELGRSTIFAKRLIASAFAIAILHIVELVTKKQMVRRYTDGTVTLMADKHTIWYWPTMEFVTKAVRLCPFAVYLNLPIAFAISGTLPVPALIECATFHIGPKLLIDGSIAPFICMSPDKQFRLSGHITVFWIGHFGNFGTLSTAAHAKSSRIWTLKDKTLLCRVMGKIAAWLTLDGSVSLACRLCGLRALTTTTLTISMRDFLRGMIGVHQNLQFWCLIRERFAVAARYCRVYYSCIITYFVA